jgi:hypothetical protein
MVKKFVQSQFSTLLAFFLCIGGFACAAEEQQQQEQTPASEEKYYVGKEQGEAWLKLVDAGNYDESWNVASDLLKMTMKQGEWTNYLDKIRGPLGKVTSRTLEEMRVAHNPQGLPATDYLVLAYRTIFSNKNGQELLIMIQVSDDQWRPMSYFIKSE